MTNKKQKTSLNFSKSDKIYLTDLLNQIKLITLDKSTSYKDVEIIEKLIRRINYNEK